MQTSLTWRTAGFGMRSAVVLGVAAAVLSIFVVVVSALDSTGSVVGIATAGTVVCGCLFAVVCVLVVPRGVLTRAPLVAALSWGAFVAPSLAGFFNASGPAWAIAPFIEETLKLCGVVLILRWFGQVTAVRGFAVGFVVGAAFEVYENILYIVIPDVPPAPGAEAGSALETAMIRLIAGFGLHAMTVSITGAAVGYLIARTGRAVGKLSGLALGAVVLVHLIWNFGYVAGFVWVFLMGMDYVALVAAFFIVRKRAMAASPPLEAST